MAIAIINPRGTYHSGQLGQWPDQSTFTYFPSGWEAILVHEGDQDTLYWYNSATDRKFLAMLSKPLAQYTPQELWDDYYPLSQRVTPVATIPGRKS